jgi:hypothetical protein
LYQQKCNLPVMPYREARDVPRRANAGHRNRGDGNEGNPTVGTPQEHVPGCA